jgi:F0F1-type ATP synthase delta subunit
MPIPNKPPIKPTVKPALRPVAKPGIVAGKAGPAVKFSDRLTDSLNDITGMIEEHKSMIDSIQDIALELTNSIGTLHTLTVKYAGIANNILDGLLPIAKGLPIIPKNILDMLIRLESITQKIIDSNVTTAKTISDVQVGLKTGDVNKIKGHAVELQNVTRQLTAMLPK